MNLLTDKKGFSMLEVLIAIVILSIAIMGLATLQSRGIRGNDLGNRTSQAVALAQDRLEDLINTSRTQTISGGSESGIDETGGAGGVFSRNWTVQTGVPVTSADTIGITIGWNDITGSHNVTLNGVITSDGY